MELKCPNHLPYKPRKKNYSSNLFLKCPEKAATETRNQRQAWPWAHGYFLEMDDRSPPVWNALSETYAFRAQGPLHVCQLQGTVWTQWDVPKTPYLEWVEAVKSSSSTQNLGVALFHWLTKRYLKHRFAFQTFLCHLKSDFPTMAYSLPNLGVRGNYD